MAFVKVAKKTDIPAGEGKVVNANGKEIALFNVEGNFHAIDNTCKHQGGPLGEGILDDAVVSCPWHGWKYNVQTGVSPVVPTVKVDTYKVKVQGEDVLVEV